MKRLKYTKTKSFFASHPTYNMLNAICNPSGENCGVTQIYKGIEFHLDSTTEDYYDEQGTKIRSVTVSSLDQPEDRWWIDETIYKGKTHISKSPSGTGIYEYDDHDNIILYKSTDEKGRVTYMKEYINEYNADGLLIKTTSKDNVVLYEYDENGRVRHEKTFCKGVMEWDFRKTYNASGELIREEQDFFGDGVFDPHQDTPFYTLVNVYTREYDSDNNCILEYLNCEDGLSPDELFTYEYHYW